MNVRKIIPKDKQAILTSFKPLFGDWDYLPFLVDGWLSHSPQRETWVAYSNASEAMLVAMAQIDELEPGDWFLRALRSNPRAHPHLVACAVLAVSRAIKVELKNRTVHRLRYGTTAENESSLRLAKLLGFRENFRLAHVWHPIPDIPGSVEGISMEGAAPTASLLRYLREGSGLGPVGGRFLTWWDTRRLDRRHLVEARKQGLLLSALQGRRMVGAAMFWHVPWMRFLVLSVMEGVDDALKGLYKVGIERAHELECGAIGLVHPSMAEMHRRQQLFGLEPVGSETVELIREGT